MIYLLDDLQNALDDYVDAAISYAANNDHRDASSAYRDGKKLDLVAALDDLIKARIRDLVKVG